MRNAPAIRPPLSTDRTTTARRRLPHQGAREGGQFYSKAPTAGARSIEIDPPAGMRTPYLALVSLTSALADRTSPVRMLLDSELSEVKALLR
jgi:hypothetical protein